MQPVCLARDVDSLRREPYFAAIEAALVADGRDGIAVVQGSLEDSLSWRDDPALVGVVAILHGAAVVQHSQRNPAPMFHANVDGTLAMVDVAAHLGARLVFISSSGTVGVSTQPQDAPDETAPFAHEIAGSWPYYASKIRAEEEARRAADRLGVSLVIFRPPIMLGPGDHRFRSTGNIIRHLRRNLPFLLPGGLHFVDIRDVAVATLRAALLAKPSPVYHLVGTACSVPAFFASIAKISGVPAPTRVLPAKVARTIAVVVDTAVHLLPGAHHSPLPDPVVFEMGAHFWGLGSTLAEAELGYQPRDGDATLADTIAWLRGHHPALSGR